MVAAETTRTRPIQRGLVHILKGRDATRIDWVAFALMAPALAFFAVGLAYPLIETFRVSFLDWTGLSAPTSAGLDNYVTLSSDPNFHNALRITAYWTFGVTIVSVFIGWSFALLSSLAPKETAPFRLMIFAAYAISETAVALMWLGILQPEYGLLNGILRGMGLEGLARPWLGNPDTALWAVMAAYIWSQAGLPLLTCYAAIQAIPKSQIEAAYVDGATNWQLIRFIMAPLSMPGVKIAIFINLLSALKAFDLIHVLTAGGPVRATETVGYFMYKESVVFFKQGYGAASTMVLLAVVVVFAIPLIRERSAQSR